MDTEGNRSKETTGVRNEILSKNTTNQLERYDKKYRHKETDSKTRKLRLFGHIGRINDNRLIKHAVFARINGNRKKLSEQRLAPTGDKPMRHHAS